MDKRYGGGSVDVMTNRQASQAHLIFDCLAVTVDSNESLLIRPNPA